MVSALKRTPHFLLGTAHRALLFALEAHPGSLGDAIITSPFRLSAAAVSRAKHLVHDTYTSNADTKALDHIIKMGWDRELSRVHIDAVRTHLDALHAAAATKKGLAGLRARRTYARSLKNVYESGREQAYHGKRAVDAHRLKRPLQREVARLHRDYREKQAAGASAAELGAIGKDVLGLEDMIAQIKNVQSKIGGSRQGLQKAYIEYLASRRAIDPRSGPANGAERVLDKRLKREEIELDGTEVPGLLSQLRYSYSHWAAFKGYVGHFKRYAKHLEQLRRVRGVRTGPIDPALEQAAHASEAAVFADDALQRAVDPKKYAELYATTDNNVPLPPEIWIAVSRIRAADLARRSAKLSQYSKHLLGKAEKLARRTETMLYGNPAERAWIWTTTNGNWKKILNTITLWEMWKYLLGVKGTAKTPKGYGGAAAFHARTAAQAVH